MLNIILLRSKLYFSPVMFYYCYLILKECNENKILLYGLHKLSFFIDTVWHQDITYHQKENNTISSVVTNVYVKGILVIKHLTVIDLSSITYFPFVHLYRCSVVSEDGKQIY
jgi:hypothetical protein